MRVGAWALLWAAVVLALYGAHAVINFDELHRMNAGDFQTTHSFWPLPDWELFVCRAAAVLGVVLLMARVVPPWRPARVELALLVAVLPALALIPVLVGPLRLGHRLHGHQTLRDQRLLTGIIALDLLIALGAVVVAAVAAISSRTPSQD